MAAMNSDTLNDFVSEIRQIIDNARRNLSQQNNDKEVVLAVARGERQPESPTEIIKDPMFLR